jgi:hypothetical protein
MNITSFAARAMALLYHRKAEYGVTRAALPQQADIILRNSAAFALSCYWARCHEGWSLVLFRDAAGAVRHVACDIPEGIFVDACGRCSEEQITQRLGVSVAASHGEEADVQALLGHATMVLEAADDLRQRVERKAARQEVATSTA